MTSVAEHSPPIRIGLVGCSSQKASARCAARDLYTSPLFRAARAYAEATCAHWLILSAKHGLLDPNSVIDPYDVSLSFASQERRERWGLQVGRQLDGALPWPAYANAELVVLVGSAYADVIHTPDVARPREFHWEEPLRGLGIGERLRWLQRNTPRAK